MTILTSRIRAALLGLIALAIAGPAAAAPSMFSGNLFLQNAYAGFDIQNTTTGYFAGVGTGMGSSPASFTVPAKFWTLYATSNMVSFPGYPNFTAYRSRSQTGTGSFTDSFLSPGAMYTLAPVTASYTTPSGPTPYGGDYGPQVLPTSTRKGVIRFTAGPNGFGGNMRFRDFGAFVATRAGQVGLYTNVQVTITRYRGVSNANGMLTAWEGSSHWSGSGSATALTYGGSGTPLMVGSRAGQTDVPFFTGNIFVSEQEGAYQTSYSFSATDNRTALGIGTISLATPQMLWTYDTNPITLLPIRQRDAFASILSANLNFTALPEPGRLALLATGLLGLFALYRVRRSH